jgi:amino acid permease
MFHRFRHAINRNVLTLLVETLGYLIVGIFLLLTIQALGELAVLYPVNGAFFSYCVRFISPAW